MTDMSRRPVPVDAMDPPSRSRLDVLIRLGRHKKLFLWVPLSATVLAAATSFLIPSTYTATTRILPPQQGQSAAASLLNQLSGLASIAGSAVGLKNPSDLFLEMLKSDSIGDSLIARFHLKETFRKRYQVDAREALARRSRFVANKSGSISIEVDARDRALAADLANAYVEELYRLTTTLAISEAAQRRVFFERQLLQTKDKLAEAEASLRKAIDSGGFVSVDAQSRSIMEVVARLRANITAKQIQVDAMTAYAAPSNPDMKRAEQELASMRQELGRLEAGRGTTGKWASGASDAAMPGGVANIALFRDVKYHEVLFELMAKQYELARVDESREAPLIQVLDRASPPEKRSSPHRSLIVLAGFIAGLAAASVWAVVRVSIEEAKAAPPFDEKLADLRRAWRLRSSK
jgi:tyrosine-protein kinase Etk/Wzc